MNLLKLKEAADFFSDINQQKYADAETASRFIDILVEMARAVLNAKGWPEERDKTFKGWQEWNQARRLCLEAHLASVPGVEEIENCIKSTCVASLPTDAEATEEIYLKDERVINILAQAIHTRLTGGQP